MWSYWIADEHHDPLSIQARATALRSSTVPAVQVSEFWRRDLFTDLAEAVRKLPYEQLLMVRDGPKAVREVDAAQFVCSPVGDHFCRHDRAVDLNRAINDPVLLG